MKNLSVEFKGTKEGLTIYCHDGRTFEDILTELAERLRQRSSFFTGTTVRVDVGTRCLSPEDEKKLADTIRENSGMTLTAIQTEKDRPPLNDTAKDKKTEGIREGRSLVIKRTLRSGQGIHFPGTVVVFGDVNPGAEIVAEGDIIVFGTFRGIAHAGASGDRSASVAALRLAPTQLRIADLFSRSPDDIMLLPDQPECAYIGGERIMISSVNLKTGQL